MPRYAGSLVDKISINSQLVHNVSVLKFVTYGVFPRKFDYIVIQSSDEANQW